MRLLFAEDDRDISKAVKILLEHAGYAVDLVYDGQDAYDYCLAISYDAIILDWMMPKMDGVTVLQKLRRQGYKVPCLILTAKDSIADKVEGLDAGADDYLAKPFATPELMARIRALLRRKQDYNPDRVCFEDLELDQGSMELSCHGKTIRLNNKAFQLLLMLLDNAGRVVSIDQIMEKVWGWDADVENSVVWVNISFIRKKLEELGSRVKIQAVRGVGYYLEKKK